MTFIREEEKLFGLGSKKNASGTETGLMWNTGLYNNFRMPLMREVDVEVIGPDSLVIRQAGTDIVLRKIDYSESLPSWIRQRTPVSFEKGAFVDFVTYKYSEEPLLSPVQRLRTFLGNLFQKPATSLI